MTSRSLGADEISIVEPLVRDYPYKPFRHYRVHSRKTQAAVLLAEIRDAVADHTGVVHLVEADGVQALAVCRTLEWDSRFFGLPMGRIDYIIAPHARMVVPVVDAALAALRERGVQHVSARVDVADALTAAGLESVGFRLMDCLVTYTTRPRKEPPHEVRELGTIRPLQPDDGPELIAIAAEAYRGYRGRFHLDPVIPPDRADAFYVEWAQQTVSGGMSDMVLVAEGAEGRLLGFLGFRRREPVSSAGAVPVFGGGLGACRSDAPGAYAGLIRAGTLWAHEREGVAECQTQNHNFPVIRVYEAVGAHYVRGEYTLHRSW